MGCAYHRGHVFDGAATTGRGFFGDVVEVAGKGLRFDPFTGDKADALAKSLGMPRDAGDFGTSILIVDTPLELRNICRGIEEYWWPRLSADLLDVVLEDADGSRPEPRPRQREDLRPFIDAFDVARLRTEIPGKSQCKTFNKLHGLSLGTLGLTVMPEPDLDDSEMALLPERQDTIALIRSPLMVVEYYGKRTMGLPPIAGAFLAHDDIDGILRRAEPPEHDRWAPNALRLDPEQHEHEIVKTILARMWRDLKSFQRSAKPEEAKRPKRLLRLERTLSDWFGSTARRPAPPAPHDAAPISIRPEVRVEAVNGGLKLSGSVLVALKPGIEVGELPVRIDLACLVREEEGVSSSDPVPLRVVHGAEVEAHEGYWVGLLAPERPIRLTPESEEYDPAWTVRFIPEVKPIDESGLS